MVRVFGSSWLFVWADGVNGCGWCLAGGRECWLKDPHQIPSLSWVFHDSIHFHQLDCLICTNDIMIIVLLLQIMGGWEGWGQLIFVRVWKVSHNFFLSGSVFVLFFLLRFKFVKLPYSYRTHSSHCSRFLILCLISLF